jgi:PAS domain S-box-containing protein
MTTESRLPDLTARDDKFIKFCGTVSRAAAALLLLGCSLSLFAWLFPSTAFLQTSPHGALMYPATSLAFVLSAISLWFLRETDGDRASAFLVDACALSAAASGAVTLGWYVLGGHSLDSAFPLSMMSPITSLATALGGGAILLVRRRRGAFASSAMVVGVCVLGILGLLQYGYNVEVLDRIGIPRHVSFLSVVMCMILGIGLLAGMRDQGIMGFLAMDIAGSIMARRLITALVFVPVLLGLFRQWAESSGLFGIGFGDGFMVLSSITTLALVVWWNAVRLNRSQLEKDRSERIRARQAEELRQTTGLLEKIFSNIYLNIFYMDTEFRILRMNQTAADHAGRPPAWFVGKNYFDHFPDREKEEVFRRVVETGEPAVVTAKPYALLGRPEVGFTYWDWALQPIKEKDGSIGGLILSMLDVTERVEAQARLREREEIEIQQEKMAALGLMAAGIAHEVRNPLTGLNFSLAAAESLCATSETLDPEERDRLARSFASARASSVRIGDVIRRVMDFVRPGRFVSESADINGAIREAVELSAPTLRKKGIKVEAALSDDVSPCVADFRGIAQLVLDLVTIAAQALEDWEGERGIVVSSRKEGDRILISVGDSGPGVPEALREKIFTPFYTTRQSGTGLGLPISRKIVADHGGSIRVEAGRLGGAEFLVSIPAHAEDGNRKVEVQA